MSYIQTILDRVMSNMKRYKKSLYSLIKHLPSRLTRIVFILFKLILIYYIVKIFEQFQSFLELCQIHFAYLLNDLVMLDEVIETIFSKYV